MTTSDHDRHALVVEKQTSLAPVLRHLLARAGITEATVVADCASAAAAGARYSLILVDAQTWAQGDRDFEAFVRGQRENGAVLGLMTTSMRRGSGAGDRAQAVDFVTLKPFTPEELSATLRSLADAANRVLH